MVYDINANTQYLMQIYDITVSNYLLDLKYLEELIFYVYIFEISYSVDTLMII